MALFLVQSAVVAVRADAPMLAALHPVNGFLITGLSVVLARGTLRLRSPSPEPTA